MDEFTAPGSTAAPVEEALHEPENGVWAEEHEFHVLVRMQGGEALELGSFPDEESADARARELITSLAEAKEWPRIRGRYIRPDSVTSVEVDERRPKVWSGSAVRGRWAKSD